MIPITPIKPLTEPLTLPECEQCGSTLTPLEVEYGCEYCEWQVEHDQRVENLRRYGAE